MFFYSIGRKVGMMQLFDKDGYAQGVTVVEAGPCVVTTVKDLPKDGYRAVQLGFGEAEHLNKPLAGHLKGQGKFKYLREFRVIDISDVKVGDKVEAGIFKPGERVNIIGISKGRGFAGVVKRYGFAGGPKTHGQSDRQRAPGSIGSTTTPGRVLKGHRMAGHMGNRRVTVKNIRVFDVDLSRNLLYLVGAVPGPDNGLVLIRKVEEKV